MRHQFADEALSAAALPVTICHQATATHLVD
jgi:hypothetical protein